MTTLIIGLLVFLGIHSISIINEPLRNSLAAKSELGWKAAYGLISIVGIYLVATGYADARMTAQPFGTPPGWLRHVSALLLIPSFVFFFASYFPGKISRALKHPQLVAVKLWAVAHLLVNWSIPDFLLFGGFLAWAVADRISMKRREQRSLPGLPASGINDVLVVILGLGVYVAFVLWLHRILIGISPMGTA